MTVVTVRPNAATSFDVTIVGGARSVQAALSDDSDVTYVKLIAGLGSSIVGFAEPSLPAGAVMKSVAARARVDAQSAPFTAPIDTVSFRASDGSAVIGSGRPTITWGTPTPLAVVQPVAWPRALSDLGVQVFGAVTGEMRCYELYADVTYVEQPTLTVDAPADGSTISDTNLPTVSWAATLDSDGGAQSSRRVRVFSEAQYTAGGFDPDTSEPVADLGESSTDRDPAGASWVVSTTLPDGSYRAYVRVAQAVNGHPLVSDWAYSEFTVDVALPADPTVAATPEDGFGRIKIDLAAVSGDATTDAFELIRSLDGGRDHPWEPVRTADGPGPLDPKAAGKVVPVDGRATAYDFEAPNGADMVYQARALHDYSGQWAASAFSTDAVSRWSDPGQCWLRNPYDPSMDLKVTVRSFPTRTQTARAGQAQPLGSRWAVVGLDTPSPETGTLVLQVQPADEPALKRLIGALVPLLLVAPAEWTGGTDDMDTGAVPFPFYFVSVGDLARTNPGDNAMFRWADYTLTWVRVPRPPGGLLTVPSS